MNCSSVDEPTCLNPTYLAIACAKLEQRARHMAQRILLLLVGLMAAVAAFAIIYVVAPILIPMLLVIAVLAVITVAMPMLARQIARLRNRQ